MKIQILLVELTSFGSDIMLPLSIVSMCNLHISESRCSAEKCLKKIMQNGFVWWNQIYLDFSRNLLSLFNGINISKSTFENFSIHSPVYLLVNIFWEHFDKKDICQIHQNHLKSALPVQNFREIPFIHTVYKFHVFLLSQMILKINNCITYARYRQLQIFRRTWILPDKFM